MLNLNVFWVLLDALEVLLAAPIAFLRSEDPSEDTRELFSSGQDIGEIVNACPRPQWKTQGLNFNGQNLAVHIYRHPRGAGTRALALRTDPQTSQFHFALLSS